MEQKFEWTEPKTLEAVSAALDGEKTSIKAGGIDLLDLMRTGLLAPKRVVGLGRVEGLRRIEATAEGGLRIGARATLAEVAQDEAIRTQYRALADATAHAATPQIREVASLGGNLLQRSRCTFYRARDRDCLRHGGERCPAQDRPSRYHAIFGNRTCAMVHPSTPATALIALRAHVVLASERGERRVPLEDFFLTPERSLERETICARDEVLASVELPPSAPDLLSRHHKQVDSEGEGWPVADAAVALRLVNGKVRRPRVVLGSAAPVPLRRAAAENVLDGKRVDVALADRAAAAALQGATPLRCTAYKVLVFRSLLRRLILETASQATASAERV